MLWPFVCLSVRPSVRQNWCSVKTAEQIDLDFGTETTLRLFYIVFYRNSNIFRNKGTPYCRAEMFAGRVACCPLVSHGKYADGTDIQTDGRTPDRYITLSARRGQRSKNRKQMRVFCQTLPVIIVECAVRCVHTVCGPDWCQGLYCRYGRAYDNNRCPLCDCFRPCEVRLHGIIFFRRSVPKL